MIQEKISSDICVSNRQRIGERIGVIGITVNSFLFAIKLTLGLLNNSVSVIADGFNNLGDCASSLVTTIGFHLSGKTTDEKHPYGYGRLEYISGFVVAMLIIVTAISVGKSSIVRILHPEHPTLTAWLFFAQVFAVFVKLLFAFYIHVVNIKYGSAALKATFKDSLADSVVTAATLLSLITSRFTALPIDGIGGLSVAIMILWAGITSYKEHLDLLLGKPASKETLDGISKVINKYDFFSV
ncbi:cation diffusion facilitator family transporter [Lacrimispora sp.]|uniref:cation diffusion facilitator family transporter n=1 Tax=Lacrimispora sp. TaxID=2719234 RepID=UPI0028AC2E14|nr:cation diffusion facilitator family transporter [Lacrimispora sp.]